MFTPLITEKSMKDANLGKFTFKFPVSSRKEDIKKIIQGKFAVSVVHVSTTIVKGRTHRVGVRRNEVKKSPFKKAIVELKKGEKISLFELGGDKKSK